MPLGKRQRKWVLGLCLGLGGIVLLWFSLPLWFPWVLRPLARSYGANYTRYQRDGYSRLALHQVVFTNRVVRFRAERIDAFVPTVWLWRCALGNASERDPFLHVKGWQLELMAGGAGNAKAASIPGSVPKTGTIFRN